MSNRRSFIGAALATAILAWGLAPLYGAHPSLNLSGLVTVETNTMALLENSQGACFCLKEGQGSPALGAPIVLRINPETGQVLVRYQGRTNELELPNGAGTNQPAVALQSASSDGVLEAYQVIAGRTLLSTLAFPRSKISLMLGKGVSRADIVRAMGASLRKEGILLKDIGDKFVIAYERQQADLVASLPSLSPAANLGEFMAPGVIRLQAADLTAVLGIYAELVQRSLLQPAVLPGPNISLVNQTACTRQETIWMMETLLRLHGLEVDYRGEKFVIIGTHGLARQVPPFPPAAAKGEALPLNARLQNADPAQFFHTYAAVCGRELIEVPPGNWGKFTFRNQGNLTKGEMLYALEALAAMRWLKFENVGDTQVRVIPQRPQAEIPTPAGNPR